MEYIGAAVLILGIIYAIYKRLQVTDTDIRLGQDPDYIFDI